MQIIGLDNQTLHENYDNKDNVVVLAPAPEEPAPAALQAQIQGALDIAALTPPELGPSPTTTLAADADASLDSRDGEARVSAVQSARLRPESLGRILKVQLAAMDSEPAAHAEWARLRDRLPRLLGSRTPLIQRAKQNDKAVWRLRIAGFSSDPQAQQFCDQLQSAGAACVIAEF